MWASVGQRNTVMKTLVHFGCSFAVGNGVPEYVEGLESGSNVHLHGVQFKEKYGMSPKVPQSCGSVLAKSLGLNHVMVAKNGASNEMIARRLLQTRLHRNFVLIGLTGYNRREALTTNENNSHWHTWKMVDPKSPPYYKDLPFTPWIRKGETHYTPALEADGQIRTVMQIIYMQSHLKLNNVQYLMFNALHNGFDKPLTNECRQLLDKVDTKHFYNLQGTFDECQHGWCLKKKLVVSELDDHPNVQGHTVWANKLLPQANNIWKN